MVVVQWAKAIAAVTLYRIVAVTPARLTPSFLLSYRYKYYTIWVSPFDINRKHGPTNDHKKAGRMLNSALKYSYIAAGEWDYPGRPFGKVSGVDGLVTSMRRHGYVQRSILREAVNGGIQVCVARDGKLVLFNEGHHRLAAARIVGLKAVPVWVRGVHIQWADRQIEVYGGALGDALDKGLAALQG